ncbi:MULTISPECIES: TetR/AcrR family transcriptional regulator [Streptomyces]|uniref:TetR/AcrR family transcriptional regulator n=1 Tax=Streptomyces TaxID=1883 RepID=UPI0006AF7565|nr:MULTISPECIES: TetR/AcrR family transcriptional regulator [unclassified Streptomyces]KOU12121.1 TetR family transcriptional regulator [Streptomyces sp. WM6349]KOU80441.1 TetR family transcriptional regulator [Streptomyces sp. XY593]KOV39408.1 TetR family transcriptional regulator [Streptomyces sp. H036]QNE29715.1 TetR/AcrR family transcriptional regulator [Streptomyces sp. INR7]
MARPRAFDEHQVLERAREQFWVTGYAGTRMDDIAQATGLGKGSLYGAFGDKGKLFHRVFGDWCTAVVEVAEGQLASGPDAEAMARLSAYVHLMAENTASDTQRRGCLLAKGTAELAQHDPAVAGRSAETMKALLTLLRTDISAAQRHGDIDSAADPERLAALLLTVVRGIEAVGKAGLDPETVRNIADTALAVLPTPKG